MHFCPSRIFPGKPNYGATLLRDRKIGLGLERSLHIECANIACTRTFDMGFIASAEDQND
jgi:hypothetical protein